MIAYFNVSNEVSWVFISDAPQCCWDIRLQERMLCNFSGSEILGFLMSCTLSLALLNWVFWKRLWLYLQGIWWISQWTSERSVGSSFCLRRSSEPLWRCWRPDLHPRFPWSSAGERNGDDSYITQTNVWGILCCCNTLTFFVKDPWNLVIKVLW